MGSLTIGGNSIADYLDNPENGNVGDVLTKTADGQEWAAPPAPALYLHVLTVSYYDDDSACRGEFFIYDNNPEPIVLPRDFESRLGVGGTNPVIHQCCLDFQFFDSNAHIVAYEGFLNKTSGGYNFVCAGITYKGDKTVEQINNFITRPAMCEFSLDNGTFDPDDTVDRVRRIL